MGQHLVEFDLVCLKVRHFLVEVSKFYVEQVLVKRSIEELKVVEGILVMALVKLTMELLVELLIQSQLLEHQLVW